MNGSGKSTFLRVFCGLHRASWESFQVYGKESSNGVPWCDQHNGLAYLGGQWTKQTGFGGPEPFSMDTAARDLMRNRQEANRERRDVLAKVLGINLDWRMNRLSDGQRKKVRIMLKLLEPFKVCVIDEFIVELDIMSRTRFLRYLVNECNERKCAIVYCTHIFDQLDEWATHVAFIKKDHGITPVYQLDEYPPYMELCKTPDLFSTPIFRLVMDFLISEAGEEQLIQGDVNEGEQTPAKEFNIFDSGFESGRSQLLFPTRADPERKAALSSV
jgi:CCR4-NOT complex subunit CAF16